MKILKNCLGHFNKELVNNKKDLFEPNAQHCAVNHPPLDCRTTSFSGVDLAANNRNRTRWNLTKREWNLWRLGRGGDRWRCAAFCWWRLGRRSLRLWLWRTRQCGCLGYGVVFGGGVLAVWCIDDGVWR